MMPRILSLKVQGNSHKRDDIPCQDSYRIQRLKTMSAVILAAADGHGSKSCPHSADGAEIAVDAFCKIMEKLIKSYKDNEAALFDYLVKCPMDVCRKVENLWKDNVCRNYSDKSKDAGLFRDLSDEDIHLLYGTTLMGVVISPQIIFAMQIGDGDIAFIDESGVSKLVETGNHLGVETYSLADRDAWKKSVVSVRRFETIAQVPSFAIILTTDGFANSYMNDNAYSDALIGYFNAIKENGADAVERNLEQWLEETSGDGCGDDITMIIAWYGAAGK